MQGQEKPHVDWVIPLCQAGSRGYESITHSSNDSEENIFYFNDKETEALRC